MVVPQTHLQCQLWSHKHTNTLAIPVTDPQTHKHTCNASDKPTNTQTHNIMNSLSMAKLKIHIFTCNVLLNIKFYVKVQFQDYMKVLLLLSLMNSVSHNVRDSHAILFNFAYYFHQVFDNAVFMFALNIRYRFCNSLFTGRNIMTFLIFIFIRLHC